MKRKIPQHHYGIGVLFAISDFGKRAMMGLSAGSPGENSLLQRAFFPLYYEKVEKKILEFKYYRRITQMLWMLRIATEKKSKIIRDFGPSYILWYWWRQHDTFRSDIIPCFASHWFLSLYINLARNSSSFPNKVLYTCTHQYHVSKRFFLD